MNGSWTTIPARDFSKPRPRLIWPLPKATRAMCEAALDVDGALAAGGATMELIDLLEQAGPYGAGNLQPVLAFPAHRVAYADIAGTDHVRCQLVAGDGRRLKAIAFRSIGTELGEMLLSERQMPLHVAGRLAANDWGGSRSPQLLIDDLAVPAGPSG